MVRIIIQILSSQTTYRTFLSYATFHQTNKKFNSSVLLKELRITEWSTPACKAIIIKLLKSKSFLEHLAGRAKKSKVTTNCNYNC